MLFETIMGSLREANPSGSHNATGEPRQFGWSVIFTNARNYRAEMGSSDQELYRREPERGLPTTKLVGARPPRMELADPFSRVVEMPDRCGGLGIVGPTAAGAMACVRTAAVPQGRRRPTTGC